VGADRRRPGGLMYARIMVPLENSPYDATILAHVRQMARQCGGSAIVLIHVADGWAARNIKQLDLRESEEMREDRAYLERISAGLRGEGFDADAVLAAGDPAVKGRPCSWCPPRPAAVRSAPAAAQGSGPRPPRRRRGEG